MEELTLIFHKVFQRTDREHFLIQFLKVTLEDIKGLSRALKLAEIFLKGKNRGNLSYEYSLKILNIILTNQIQN